MKDKNTLNETASRIEQIVEKIGLSESDKKDQLLQLLAKLKSEIEILSRSHSEQAESIVGFLGTATHEATRADKSPALQKLSQQALLSSAMSFEASHPRLVETV